MRGKNYNNMKGRGKLKRGHVLGGMPYPLNKKRKREGGRMCQVVLSLAHV